MTVRLALSEEGARLKLTHEETSEALAPLPLLNFRTGDLPPAEAFAHWRELMRPLFQIEQARYTSALPRGNLSMYVVGEIMINRCTFNAQHLSRDPTLIAATPDHLVLQYYRSGGFRGMIAGQPVCIVRGQVAVADLSQEVDAYAANSDTIGLSVPRALLGGIEPEALTRQLDTPRNRLLGSYMASLPKRAARMSVGDVPALTAEVAGLLRRVFSPGRLEGVTVGIDQNQDILERALVAVEGRLAARDLSAAFLADMVGTSRATLYRLFAPMGGIMRYVQERRLMAVRDVLSDPLDRRPLVQLAPAHGFASQAVLSRGFRARFGVSPRDWRRRQADLDLSVRQRSPDRAHLLWRELGRSDGDR